MLVVLEFVVLHERTVQIIASLSLYHSIRENSVGPRPFQFAGWSTTVRDSKKDTTCVKDGGMDVRLVDFSKLVVANC